MDNLGQAFQNARKKQGLTIDEVASRAGLSKGYISKVERGISVPSYTSLQKICTALKISATDIMPISDKKGGNFQVVRKNDRELVYDYSGILCFESIHRTSHFALQVMTISGTGDEYERSMHAYDEINLVTKGKVLFTIEDRSHIELEEGDMLYIPKGTKHYRQKMTREEAIIYSLEVYD